MLLRADGDGDRGVGHVARCLALAAAWREVGGLTHFVTRAEARVEVLVRARTDATTIVPTHASQGESVDLLLRIADDIDASWIVLDGYDFAASDQRRIRAAGRSLLVIDDMAHLAEYHATVLLNQNLVADRLIYRTDPDTDLLLGTRYALLRPELLEQPTRPDDEPDVARRVLITLGAADPHDVTSLVLRALTGAHAGLAATVVIGPTNARGEEVAALARSIGADVTVAPPHLAEHIAASDLAISAAGSTCLELCYFGVPTVAIVTAENQRLVAEGLEEAGAVESMGWHDDLDGGALATAVRALTSDRGRRQSMSSCGRRLVDGLGARRVVARLRRQDAGARVRLRPVAREDRELLFRWANDPAVRDAALDHDPIDWATHVDWFARMLDDPRCANWIAQDGETPIGNVRLDARGDEATVTLSVAPEHRGNGYAVEVVASGLDRLADRPDVRQARAVVRAWNAASRRVFERCGFRLAESDGELLTYRRALP